MTETEAQTLPLAVFWDMDGTLIDSEPYWHDGEIAIATANGGYWTEELGWQCTGTPVPLVAQRMVDLGTQLSVDEIGTRLIDYVARREREHMPWIPGATETLRAVAEAGIPSVLVTASPRHMAEALVRQAPDGAFAGYVCGDDDLPKKPDPASYLQAARVLGFEPRADLMARCIAIEDSAVGLRSAVSSGATTLALTGFVHQTGTEPGPRFESIERYDGVTAATLRGVVERRLRTLA